MLIAYWAVVAVGAVTLIIEAYRQFSTPLDVEPHDRYPILKNVDLDALCTKGELIRGFMMYAALYIGAYGIILTSAELYELINDPETTSVSGSSVLSVIGARSGEQDDIAMTDTASAFDLSKPIFVSAAIVSALSIGLFAPIERLLRAYAHWLAAIPRGVYRVIGSLKRANYKSIAPRVTGTLEKAFADQKKLHPEGVKADTGLIQEIEEILKTADVLHSSVLGSARDQMFPVWRHRALETLIDKLTKEHQELREAIQRSEFNEETLEALHTEARRFRNNIQALFALLYIRNEKTADVTQVPPSTMRLIDHLKNDREPVQHALAGAIFFMATVVLLIYPTVYFLSWWNSSGRVGSLPRDLVHFIRDDTLTSLIQTGAMFGLCSATALLSREASMEYGRWPEWPLNKLPFMRFFSHALFPGLVAVLVCSVAKILEYLIAVENNSFGVFVATNWKFCLMNFVFGFCVAIIAFMAVDQHERLSAPKTLALTLAASVPYVLWAIFVQSLLENGTSLSYASWLFREVFLLSLPALTFALAFSTLLEISEDRQQ